MSGSKPTVVVPRGPELLTYVNDLVVQNRLLNHDASIALPPLRTRALMLVHERDPLVVRDYPVRTPYAYSR